jgi:hypothetical protein
MRMTQNDEPPRLAGFARHLAISCCTSTTSQEPRSSSMPVHLYVGDHPEVIAA